MHLFVLSLFIQVCTFGVVTLLFSLLYNFPKRKNSKRCMSVQQTFVLKVSFEDDMFRVRCERPESLDSLLNRVSQLLGDKLVDVLSLQYRDADGVWQPLNSNAHLESALQAHTGKLVVCVERLKRDTATSESTRQQQHAEEASADDTLSTASASSSLPSTTKPTARFWCRSGRAHQQASLHHRARRRGGGCRLFLRLAMLLFSGYVFFMAGSHFAHSNIESVVDQRLAQLVGKMQAHNSKDYVQMLDRRTQELEAVGQVNTERLRVFEYVLQEDVVKELMRLKQNSASIADLQQLQTAVSQQLAQLRHAMERDETSQPRQQRQKSNPSAQTKPKQKWRSKTTDNREQDSESAMDVLAETAAHLKRLFEVNKVPVKKIKKSLRSSFVRAAKHVNSLLASVQQSDDDENSQENSKSQSHDSNLRCGKRFL